MSTGGASARVLVTVLAVAGLLLAGCGSGGSEKSAPEQPSTTASSETGSAAPQAEATVRVDNMAFGPSAVTISVGGTVTWKFSDSAPHAVQGIGDSAMGLDSPIFREGEWSHTFTAPGTYRYLCPLHPNMRGTVTVQ
ncbi:plastocyanin/azurin family copper-binding protein [Nocardia blacklockiae]|uniref:plastocyanin/azurin family copper-binding protein n=1 Tax=Nocardia blacklockiae TaxID=480036 RepID=UPI0018938097|nr:plastocyanin/azurin family copper-binding protein [Nocardia blacklockiae]MBF6172602.1 cupredoxin domain-containing protein [Nocardia blacklockiae]